MIGEYKGWILRGLKMRAPLAWSTKWSADNAVGKKERLFVDIDRKPIRSIVDGRVNARIYREWLRRREIFFCAIRVGEG